MAYVGIKPAAITSATEAEIAGDLTVDTNTLKVDAANNRVGVGTVSPVLPLEVNGSTNVAVFRSDASNSIIQLANSTGTGGDNGVCIGSVGDDLFLRAGDSERMRIDSSGNVGIGETSPATPLHISTGASTTAELRITSNNTGSGSGDRGRIAVYSSRNDGTAYEAGRMEIDRSSGTADEAHIMFYTNGGSGVTERMRIDSNGHVGINDTNPSEAQLSVVTQQNESAAFIHCNASSMTGATLAVSSSRNTTGGTYSHLECAIHGVAVKMKVLDSGNVKNTNNSYGSISDQRMKENIVDAASQWDDIKALQVRKYNRIGETQKEIGVIAQELEASGMGGLVEEGAWYDAANNPDDETRKSVKYSVLYMKAVKALQEAMTRIETLETEMTALKARVTALEDA